MDQTKKFNLGIIIVIWGAIIANLCRTLYDMYMCFTAHDTIHLYNILVHIISIIILYQIIEKRKKEFFYIFVILNIINAIVIGGLNNTNYFPHVFAAIIYIIILRAILCLKKDNISGWDILE